MERMEIDYDMNKNLKTNYKAYLNLKKPNINGLFCTTVLEK